MQTEKCLSLQGQSGADAWRGFRIVNFNEEQNKDILDYLNYNWPDQLRVFYFSASTHFGSADYYLNGITEVV